MQSSSGGVHLTPLGKELFSSSSGTNLHKTPEGLRFLFFFFLFKTNAKLQVLLISAAVAVAAVC